MKVAAILSDFTLGFSDGLTVPFALTAGLSSLGQSDTVIYAGLAEVCAGCISMGIGGYLSARDANRQNEPETEDPISDDEKSTLLDDESDFDFAAMADAEGIVVDYLRPLDLPAATLRTVLSSLRQPQSGLHKVSRELISINEKPKAAKEENPRLSPIFSGFIISLGYLCGGLIPLLPYCFSHNVGQGFRWSIAVCLVALFFYGTVKEFALGGNLGSQYRRTVRAVGEGIQMALLGAMAAGAAVLCVSLVEGQST